MSTTDPRVAVSADVRLFVAVEPGAEAIDAVRALPRPPIDGVRWADERMWHVTLRFLGELPDPGPVVSAIDAVDLGPPVYARLGARTRRLNPNVLVVPVGGLDDLAARVRAATADLGQPPDDRRFDGHLTIARRRRRGGKLPTGAPIDVAVRIDEVLLFSSRLSERGPAHEVVRRWPLRDGTAPPDPGVPSGR